jgi:uncharacterized membrane protein YedE/YeeE
MLLLHGRVTGITGIMTGLSVNRVPGDLLWRVLFLAGLALGGAVVILVSPELFDLHSRRGFGTLLLAGLLVGFGTRMGSGCTSGHGVCGLSRLSGRSLVATATFMTTGILTAIVVRRFLAGVV